MAMKIKHMDNPRRPQWRDEGMSGGAASEDLPEAPDVERTANDQALLDQGLRLNRAFISIDDPLVREAIINLVVEAARNESGETVFLSTAPPGKTDL
jgi:hypothetical protein